MIENIIPCLRQASTNAFVGIGDKFLEVFQKKKGRLLLLFSVWLTGILIGHMIVEKRIDRLTTHLCQSGVEMAPKIAVRSSLPLLEQDIPSLHTLLDEACAKPHVVNVAIVDHENNIIAHANSDSINWPFFSPKKGTKARAVEQVSIWEGPATDNEEIITFSSDVTYGSTKIGRVYLALSAAEIAKARHRFMFTTLSSLVVLFFLVFILHYKDFGSAASMLKGRQRPRAMGEVVLKEMSQIGCPLCGSDKPVSQEVFNHIDLDRFLILHSPNGEPGRTWARQTKGIPLSEVARREDLGWLKRQVICRCAEIIKKVAA
jgi:hypothetical protein